MQLWETFMIAIGLAMDALAVSVTQGFLLAGHQRRRERIWMTAIFFGVFQAIMPLLGYFLGQTFAASLQRFGGWIAFLLLLFLGGKMIWDALRRHREDSAPVQPAKLGEMVLLAVATSIDAFAVGITYSLTGTQNIWANVGIIGLVAALISFFGASATGRIAAASTAKTKRDYTKPAAIFGGAVLIAIGVKILLENIL